MEDISDKPVAPLYPIESNISELGELIQRSFGFINWVDIVNYRPS